MSIVILEKESVRELVLPLSVDAYHKLGELGALPEKTELLEGVVIQKMPKNPKHTETLQRLFKLFLNHFKEEYEVRKEEPIVLGESEPEPDLAIVDKKESGYFDAHPNHSHLIIEVANTSLALDRSKAQIYAKGKIPEYWIVNLLENTIEVYRNPIQSEYSEKRLFRIDEEVSPIIDKNLKIRLLDLIQ